MSVRDRLGDTAAMARSTRLVPLLLAAALASAGAADAAPDAEVHSFHCLHACPAGASATNDLVVREIYTLSSNDFTKFADWVAYRVTRETIGPSGDRRWSADPWLAPDETLEPDDYRDAFAQLSSDRGHQAPLASFSGTPFAADTNILSNITAQKSALNQGSWQVLEGWERALAQRTGAAVYVLTGPLYEGVPAPLPGADEPHRIPTHYWKVIATADGLVSAFLFEQGTPRGVSPCTRRVPLAEVELRARLHLFPRLAERRFGSLDSALGCP